MLVEIEPDGPYVPRLQRTFGADVLPGIPRTPYDRVRAILTDGVADPEECNDLFSALSAFTAGDAELDEASKATSLPLCHPAPSVSFEGMTYCFTGTFNFPFIPFTHVRSCAIRMA